MALVGSGRPDGRKRGLSVRPAHSPSFPCPSGGWNGLRSKTNFPNRFNPIDVVKTVGENIYVSFFQKL